MISLWMNDSNPRDGRPRVRGQSNISLVTYAENRDETAHEAGDPLVCRAVRGSRMLGFTPVPRETIMKRIAHFLAVGTIVVVTAPTSAMIEEQVKIDTGLLA